MIPLIKTLKGTFIRPIIIESINDFYKIYGKPNHILIIERKNKIEKIKKLI